MVDQRAILERIIARFPTVFGLRAFPGDRFRLSLDASYFPTFQETDESKALLYVMRLNPHTGEWLAFVKGTEAELRREIRPLD